MSLKLCIGSMFSGKTSYLIKKYKKYTRTKNVNVIVIGHTTDNRYSNENFVCSHNNNKVPCIKTKKLTDIDENIIRQYDHILIDEGQFFDDILIFCSYWCDKFNKNILVCALNADYLRNPFMNTNSLMSVSDKIINLKATCIKCNDGSCASFTKRLTHEKEQIVVGSDNYIPVCRKHYLE